MAVGVVFVVFCDHLFDCGGSAVVEVWGGSPCFDEGGGVELGIFIQVSSGADVVFLQACVERATVAGGSAGFLE